MRPPARRRRRYAALGLAVVGSVLWLVGCSGSGRTIRGRVLTGRASVVTVVDADDPRLAEPGVAEVAVRLTRGGGEATSLAESITGRDGSFALRVEEQFLYRRLEVVAQGPYVLTCRGSVYAPRDDQRVLIWVEPSHARPAESQGVGEQAR